MANTIAYAQIFQNGLDRVLEQNLTTGWTEANADRVIYNGGNTVRIAKMTLDSLADYSRANGYADGDITLTWETHTFAYDRGRKFSLDAMDIDEANFVPTASLTMGEFVRTKVVPEIDLIRIAKMAGLAGNSADIDLDTDDPLEAFKNGIVAIKNAGYDGQLVAHVTYDFLNLLELKMANQLGSVTFAVSGVDTTFRSIDDVALIPTVAGRMKEVATKQANGSYLGTGKDVAFLIAGLEVPLGIVKHAPARTFEPKDNQEKDAWVINYRVYHDLFVEDNKVNGLYAGFISAGD